MTIFNIGKLPVASFRNIDVHFQNSNIEGGRKTVTHEYPDSNSRYVEDLGLLQKIFNIEFFVENNVSFGLRDQFTKALDQSGLGTLIHPFFGSQQVVVKNYTIIDNINNLGVSKFNVTFERAELNKLPSALSADKGFVSSLRKKIFGDSESKFNSLWQDVKSKKQAFDSANATIKQSARKIKKASQVVQGSADTFGDFSTAINEIIDSSRSLVGSPTILANNFKTAFSNLRVAYNSSEGLFEVAKFMFGFNERDRSTVGTSSTQKTIRNNQDQINNLINANNIALAYEAASNIEYTNLDQLNRINSDLESGFESLPTLDDEIYSSIVDMRVEITKIFANLSIGLPRVIDFEARGISLNVLIYQLYGSLDFKDQIRNLNQFSDTSRIEGTIKILSNI